MKYEVSNIPDKEYFAIPAISSTGIKALLKSPAHFKALENSSFDSKALRIGSATHQILLGGDNCLVLPGSSRTTKEAKEIIKNEKSKTVLTKDEWSTAELVANTLSKTASWQTLMEDAECEVSFVGEYMDGTKAKAKADIVKRRNKMIADVKTTSDIHNFQRSIFNFRYDIQAAWYSRLFSYEFPVESFLFIAVETAPPYDSRFFVLDEEVIENANEEIDQAIEIYRRCIKTDEWPGYEAEIIEVGLPAWMRK